MGIPGGGMLGANTTMPGWNEAVDWWSKLARGTGVDQSAKPTDAMVDRFNAQARGWYAQMQQLAAQFAGQDANATDIAGAWKRALGGDMGNPFAEVMRSMQGPGQQGFDQWFAQTAPFIEKMQRDAQAWTAMPTFGFTREHQERWQRFARSQADYQQQSQAYQALMAEAAQDAFKRFEQKLAARSEPGKQLESARALFDLWIDAAEDAYADIALSPRFRDAYGALVNAQMRLRAAVQGEVEQMGEAFGIPTRSEVDAAHRKIVQLERELRRLRDLVSAPASGGSTDKPAANQPEARSAPARKSAKKKPAAVRKPAVKKAAAKKTPAKKTSATKASTKKSPGRAAVTKTARKVR